MLMTTRLKRTQELMATWVRKVHPRACDYPFNNIFRQYHHSPTWIILDSASSIDLFVNKDLLSNVKVAETPIRIMANAGDVTLRQYGTLPGYPEPVWYHPDGAANVLSLHNVANHFKVTYNGRIPLTH
jgi:hypothetical protein